MKERPSAPFRLERTPTSHEQSAGRPWDASYTNGPAPWDIGKPQPALVHLADTGCFLGTVLDVGCGSGENALHLASRGLSVVGVDVAETALAIARQNAGDRNIEADFFWGDALHLERLGRAFDTVLDCGLFHTFGTEERTTYATSVASVTKPSGTLYVLCFSDEGADIGPHPVRSDELFVAFCADVGWEIVSIAPARLETRTHDNGASAWLAIINRVHVSL